LQLRINTEKKQMKMIDLRSDTVTKPSPAMIEAVSKAEVGDDVFGEDPTVNTLQNEVAEMFGKEAGLFVPTGVMGNQLAIKAQTDPGDEVIVEEEAHIFHYESAAPSILSSVQLFTLESNNGSISPEKLRGAIRSADYHNPKSRLLCLENTHNRHGGTVYPFEEMKTLCGEARKYGLRLHLDGARIWNASVASGVTFADYGKLFDTVSVCFSKGLGAPIGSMLLGDSETITRAHRFRKVFGGGMRQVGVIAAAALYSIRHNIYRMSEDHEKALIFREVLSDVDNLDFLPRINPTNMCIIDITKRTTLSVDQMLDKLKHRGVLLTSSGRGKIRAVMHLDVTAEDVINAANIVKKVLLD
jgi:threonine aldolase